MSTENKTITISLFRYLLLLISMILLLGACASTDRMMRITPFGRDEVSDPDRVNLWPLLYQSQDRTSVLWPLFDMDDKGFALRPLVALEGDSISALGPLAGWDWKKDIWWVTPAYKLENNIGVFPVFGLGNKASYIGPVYWWKDGSGEPVNGFGIFPLGYYGQTWGHMGPAYWFKERSGGGIKGMGIFPLGYYGQKWGYFGTAWWTFDSQDNLKKGGLFPLLTLGTTVEQVGPVFWDNDNDDNTRFLTVLPLFHYGKNGDAFRFISPLGGRGWSSDRNTRFTNILGPFFHMYRHGEETDIHVLWPVFYFKTGPDVTSTRLFPLFSRNVRGSISDTRVLWPLVHIKTGPYMNSTRIFPLYSRQHQGSMSTTSLLLGTFKHKQDEDRHYLRLWPFFSDSDMGLNPDPVDFFTLYSNLRDNNNASRVQVGTGLLFRMNRDSKGEITDWNTLLWAVRYSRVNETRKYNVLWYLYRVNQEGENINRDIFPFITWDTAPDSSRFSFLSRVFSYERTGTGRRLHVLFIPLWNSSHG